MTMHSNIIVFMQSVYAIFMYFLTPAIHVHNGPQLACPPLIWSK